MRKIKTKKRIQENQAHNIRVQRNVTFREKCYNLLLIRNKLQKLRNVRNN